METLNFELKDNKAEVENYLFKHNYKKIGHKKDDCIGFCIMIKRRQFFEISAISNKNILTTSNFADLSLCH